MSELDALADIDGDANPDRPESWDGALSPPVRLGYRKGAPIADRDYSEYLRQDAILLPDARKFLSELASSEFIGSVEDLAAELGMDNNIQMVRGAVDLHSIEFTERTEYWDGTTVKLPDGSTVDKSLLQGPLDIRLLTHLLRHYSVSETTDFLSQQYPDERVRERDVRDAAKEVSLLND